ncbi:8-amino-7-oxononanoate synthase [Porphyromonas gingivalis]|uniref:8-amino-7-oxononanoate synthase n=1 Tax=Porphyromonas gingivalis TaxID=837 RepID=UPI001F24F0CD|nr:8-amino-7-oxononanoate synthase [Porphyromonas gingivalis]MCE8179312.1 8-amino-7-oxononanoate synthase [Porphyromonas gingivalis]
MNEKYKAELQELEESGSLRQLRNLVHDGSYIIEEERRMLNLSSNDYLGLTAREDLINEFYTSISGEDRLPGSCSSRLLTGNSTAYDRLERTIAERFGRESSLIFNSGYHLNTGVLPALVDGRTLIVADRLVHASIIDGIRLCGTPFERFRHNDPEHLERILHKNKDLYSRIIIAVESIYSMDGDVADLPSLVGLKELYPTVELYVDEAHAIGVRGKTGLGLAEETATIGKIDYLVGTFGKALASMGAYIVCDNVVREYLINRSRSLIFSTALPPATIGWTELIFRRLPEFVMERKRLEDSATLLRDAIKGKGIEMPSSSHIIPYMVGENAPCIALAEHLQDNGFFVLPIRHPTVPLHTARLRFSLTAALDTASIYKLIDILP